MRFVLAVLAAVAAEQPPDRWTFCVAEAGHEIWITDVFLAARGREQLEAHFKAELNARGVRNPDPQCPEPLKDKIEALNALFTAEEFHRKLGDRVHAVAPPDDGAATDDGD